MAFVPTMVPPPPVPPRRGGSGTAAPLPPGGRGPLFYPPRTQPPRRQPSFVEMPRPAHWPRGRLVLECPRPVQPFIIARRPNEMQALQLLVDAGEDPAAVARRRWRELRQLQGPGGLDGGAGEEEGLEEPEPEQGARHGWFRALVGAVGHVLSFVRRVVLPGSEDPPAGGETGDEPPLLPPAPPVPPHRELPPEDKHE